VRVPGCAGKAGTSRPDFTQPNSGQSLPDTRTGSVAVIPRSTVACADAKRRVPAHSGQSQLPKISGGLFIVRAGIDDAHQGRMIFLAPAVGSLPWKKTGSVVEVLDLVEERLRSCRTSFAATSESVLMRTLRRIATAFTELALTT